MPTLSEKALRIFIFTHAVRCCPLRYVCNTMVKNKVHIIQKNGEKLFSLKITFVDKNSQKSILYKRKKVVFSFFRPYYTNFIFFTTYHKCMHKRFFLGRRKRMYTAVAVVDSVLPFLFLKDGFMSCASFMLCCVLYIAMFCCCLVLI